MALALALTSALAVADGYGQGMARRMHERNETL